MKLLEMGQKKEVIIAGILHDLVEDTDCTVKQIRNVFGPNVANMVAACTRSEIDDYKLRWHKLIRNRTYAVSLFGLCWLKDVIRE